jgi:hypothetical protein
MEITINGEKKLHEIQEQFSAVFPYLKIEFYKEPHLKGEASSKRYILNPTLKIRDVQAVQYNGVLHVEGDMKVSELENTFSSAFGLPVQVFRKSYEVWLQTLTTDDWTLDKQNRKGVEMSKLVKNNPDENDYHEQK